MDVIRFFLGNVLAPVFGNDLDFTERSPSKEHNDDGKQEAAKKRSASKSATTGDSILDLSGPRLLDGAASWLLFYRLVGQINFSNKPFYLSIIYKMSLLAFASYATSMHIVIPLFNEMVVDATYSKNPIFLFMIMMTCLISGTAFVTTFYQNMFKLSPLFKILTMPRLCFINRSTQDVSGTHTTRWMVFFLVYHCWLVILLGYRDLGEFVANFNLFEFLILMYAIVYNVYHTIGLVHLDFYIRFSFSAWLWALKCNLQYRRPRLAYLRYQMENERRSRELSSASTSTSLTQRWHEQQKVDDSELMREFKRRYAFVELKEVQMQLNTMDDHLEVWRSCQTGSLVCLTLSAFFTNGIILMLSYSTLTQELDTFRGLIWALVGINYAILITICYIGDSFIAYALACFVQTVEDEYFLQQGDSLPISLFDGREDEEDELKVGILRPNQLKNLELERQNEEQNFCRITDDPLEELDQSKATDCLLIKKEDVLFCRELSHQFDNHLATPWSRLSLKSHLNIMAAFATLIAAQIIFDREIKVDFMLSKVN